ncbi:MAG: hypothetical protein KAI66_13510 [Lentisphaeria bacterium]|nr:hypothetical protein [Lentisphaeria bacterium]
MKALWRRIQRDWEPTVQWGMLTALLVLIALICTGVGSRRDLGQKRGRTPQCKSLFTSTSFAFFEDIPAADGAANPFDFSTELPGRRPPARKPAKINWQKFKPKPAVKPKPKLVKPRPPKPKPIVKKVPPPPKYRYAEVKYLFLNPNQSGKQVAIAQFIDPVTKQPRMESLSAGDKIHGIRVHSFTEQALNLIDARGRKHRILYGEAGKVAATAQ